MSIPATFLDQARVIPQRGETGWGAEVTDQLYDLLRAADWLIADDGLVTPSFLLRLQAASTSCAAGSTLTPTKVVHKVVGNPGDVSLAGIANGSKDGQLLILVGTNDAKRVTLVHAGTLALNGDITLGAYASIRLLWDSVGTKWYEIGRSE